MMARFLDYADDYLPGQVYRAKGKRAFSKMKEEKDPFGSEPARVDGGEMFAQFLALNNQGAGALMPSMPAQLQGYM